MRVLGIDPGLTRCGLGVVDGRAGRASMVAVGVVRTPAAADPFPPPFRWADPVPVAEPAEAEVTQVVPGAPDTTQVVPRPDGPSAFHPPSFGAPPERTQVVPGALAGRRPSPPVPAARTTPPWTERERTERSRPPAPPAPGYRPEVLATLFGASTPARAAR